MARFRPRQRLRRRSEFDRVFTRGARLDGSLFVLLAVANELSLDRLGLVVSRRVGRAVERNRGRRLLREAFRRLERGSRPSADFVFIAKTGLVTAGLSEVDGELRRRLRGLERRTRLGRAHPPVPD